MDSFFTIDEEIAAVDAEAIKAGVPKEKIFGGKITAKMILRGCGFTDGPAEVRKVALKFGHFER